MNKTSIVLLLSIALLFAHVMANDSQQQEGGQILLQNSEDMNHTQNNDLGEADQGEQNANLDQQNQDQGEASQDQGEIQDQGEQNQDQGEQNQDQGEQNQDQGEQNQDQGEQDQGEQDQGEQDQGEQDQGEQDQGEQNQDQGEQNHDESAEEDECSKTESCLCHPSCICEKGSTICSKCKLESLGAVMDDHKKSCPCPVGYYTSSIKPFKCDQLFVPDQEGQIDTVGACDREVSMKSRYVSLNTNCYYCVIDDKSYVVSEVSLNFNSVSISSECKSSFKHKIQFLHPTSQTYVDLDAKYFVEGENGGLKLSIPLIDVYHLTLSSNVGESQIAQQINLMSYIGTKDKVMRKIKWAICVYTNRDQVQIFQLDTDIQQTEQDCEDCVVIADLETIGEVYTDDSFETKVSGTSQYFVGDYFYAKIRFVDASYTKYLRFVALYYKNDLGQIYDYSSITVHSWKSNGLTIALPLSEPSHPAVIQVQMVIDSANGGRFLQATQDAQTDDKQKSNFSLDVQSNSTQQPAGEDETKQSTSSQLLLLGLVNLMSLVLLI